MIGIFKTAKSRRGDDFYKCPGCGEMVDNRDRDSVRLHHDHVLHSRSNYVTYPLVPRSQERRVLIESR